MTKLSVPFFFVSTYSVAAFSVPHLREAKVGWTVTLPGVGGGPPTLAAKSAAKMGHGAPVPRVESEGEPFECRLLVRLSFMSENPDTGNPPTLPMRGSRMNSEMFASLLYQNESDSLDFKRDAYQFEGGTLGKKAALLQDMIAMANSWRQSTAYLVLGVEDGKAVPKNVCGLQERLIGRNLQQFVSSKLNKPLNFSVEELTFEGKEVAVIAIPVQERPFYLRQDYGQVRGNIVYVRRGDTNAEASPDEVLKMGAAVPALAVQPNLKVKIGDYTTREQSERVALECNYLILPKLGDIPDYGFSDMFGTRLRMENPSYYRQWADRIYSVSYFKPFSLAVSNDSGQHAANVTLRAVINVDGVELRANDDMPPIPNQLHAFTMVPPSSRRGIEVDRRGKSFELVVRLGTIQPGTTEWIQEPLYIASRISRNIVVEITASADNLQRPISAALSIDITTSESTLTKERLLDLVDKDLS